MATLLTRMLVAGMLFAAAPATAVAIDWVAVGNPGNACESQPQGCFGAVGHDYKIARHEVTNAQYAEFLNAVAGADPYGLYNTSMGSGFGGITQDCTGPSCTYATITGREAMPVNYVSLYDSLRFANWLHNGQGSADTETGAYTLLGGTANPSNGTTVTRNAGATIFLTSEDEWYKAAYHNALGLSATDYFDFPAGTDAQTTCAAPSATANTANCGNAVGDLTAVGSYTGSASPYGTFDQGGNVMEWNEAITGSTGCCRSLRGGSHQGVVGLLSSSSGPYRGGTVPHNETAYIGFRVATVPEPGTGLLLMLGLLGLAQRPRARA